MKILLIVMGFISATIAFFLSFQVGYGSFIPEAKQFTRFGGVVSPAGGVDIAADGGALGFAILSGLCFVAVAILEKDSKRES